jgi:hypothetical protein
LRCATSAAIARSNKRARRPRGQRKPGYANFAVDSPPIELVLSGAPDAAERLSHAGVETDDNDGVEATIARLALAGIVDRVERDETCCYAKKSTVWSSDPRACAGSSKSRRTSAPSQARRPAGAPRAGAHPRARRAAAGAAARESCAGGAGAPPAMPYGRGGG